MKKLIYLIFVFTSLFHINAFANDYMNSVGSKFGRGVENIVTSPAEIPCTMESEMHQGDRIIRFFTGAIKGTFLFLRRAVVGATEIVTFPVPMDRTIPRVCNEAAVAATE